MNVMRRLALAALGAGTLTALAPGLVHAQGKMLRILVGYPPGGAVDVVAREVAEGLRAEGYNPIVENRTGAAGRLATEQMLQAPADGGTVVLMPGGNLTIFPHVYPKLGYKPQDLAPISTVCSFSFGLAAGPGSPAKTLKEFIAWAKANPGKASYGTPGGGTAMHFMGVMLARQAGVELTHVPYRGGAQAMVDVLGGNLPALATTLPNLVTPHKQGKVRILAFSGEKPLSALPGVPTFKEAGYPELVITETFGVFASAKTAAAVQTELHKAINAAASQPRVVAALEKLEFEPLVTSQTAYAARLKAELDRWGPIIKATGYKAED
jgi:tripartite-type tricarboxylate transporter receptor subunit TctC